MNEFSSTQSRQEALEPGRARDDLINLHPIYRRLPKIKTEPIRKALLVIYETVQLRRTGCAFTGEWRCGKTNALSLIADLLPEMVSNIATMRISARKHKNPTNGMIYGDLLKAVGRSTKGTELERFDRFINCVVGDCIAVQGNRMVVFMDEGQNWGEDEFTVLRDVSNHLLLHHDIDVITIIFGGPKLRELSNTFRSSRKDLSSRFLHQPITFFGLKDEQELVLFFSQLDDPRSLEYPAGTGLSCTEFFLNLAYQAGYRLAQDGPTAWAALINKVNGIGIQANGVGIQTRYLEMSVIMDVVKTFLLEQRKYDHEGYRPTADAWSLAIDASAFAQSLV